MIQIQLNDSILNLGDTIAGSCQWLPSPDGEKKTARLAIGWRTEGRGDVDRQTIYEAELQPQIPTRFSCRIPTDMPLSYDGELLRILWEVAVDFKSGGIQGRLGWGKSREAKVFRVVADRNR